MWSYHALNNDANRAANALRGLGVGRGDRVALFLPNIPAFVVAYLGALKLGAVVVSLNAMLKQPEVAFALNDCGAAVVITTAELRPQVPDGQQVPWHIIVAEGPPGDDTAWARLLDQASPTAQAVRLPSNAPAAIVYTSGTTGVPKGATLSHGNVHACMVAKKHYCGTHGADRLLLFLPLFHCFGQNAILNNALHAGATLVLQRRFHAASVVESVVRHRVSMLFGVPTVFIKLLEMGDLRHALDSVRYFFAAGASMPTEIAARWRALYGLPIYEGYGLTETSPFACYNHVRQYQSGSIGMPIDGVDMQIVDPDGCPVAVGERGEIVIRGPNVMLGYWNRAAETAAALRQGWFHSGDIGTVDEQGYFYIVDRLKDMINVSGFKVYPAEVEQALYQHPAVAEAAVYGQPDATQGEVVKANVRLRAGRPDSADDIIAFCRARIAAFKVPRTIEFVDAIPKNATGKVLRRVLRDQAARPS